MSCLNQWIDLIIRFVWSNLFFAFRTLLVCDIDACTFYSFDSMSASRSMTPTSEAKRLSKKLKSVITKIHTQRSRSNGSSSSSNSFQLIAPKCAPQQSNSSDCGMYVLAVAEAIARARQQDGKATVEGESVAKELETITPSQIAKKRQQIIDIINKQQKA